jgi:copper chaperone NosL
VLELLSSGESMPNVLWVVDYETGGWVRASDAWFVRSNEIRSPMGFGIAAFSSETEARGMTRDVSGKVLRFAGLKRGAQLQNREERRS